MTFVENVREKIHCRLYGKDFVNFMTHTRVKHPEFYQMQLTYEIEMYQRLQHHIEQLDPSIAKVPRGNVLYHKFIKHSMPVEEKISESEGSQEWER